MSVPEPHRCPVDVLCDKRHSEQPALGVTQGQSADIFGHIEHFVAHSNLQAWRMTRRGADARTRRMLLDERVLLFFGCTETLAPVPVRWPISLAPHHATGIGPADRKCTNRH